ncbi:MAG: ParB N-terminal domain-containing protein [Deltaproteobacteria bacterium]|nr:ParB N-terminal domain-containing protein [Deltaproteobacteria bacterium]
MRYKEQVVWLSSIDFMDDSYHITTETHIDDLSESIKSAGLINLPLLKKKGSKYTIVSGFRRISALKQLGRTRIKSRILEPGTEELACIKFAIADNSFQRTLNLVENSRALCLLSPFYKNNDSLTRASIGLGLPGSPSWSDKIKNICHLPLLLQRAIISGDISLPMAMELGIMPSDEALAVVKLFDGLKLSLNKQREILTFIREISLRETLSILDLLEDNRLKEILNDKDLDRVQKTRMIRFNLKKRRFPAIVKIEQEFEAKRKRLNLVHGLKLIPPKNFESTEFMLTMSFKSLTDLKNLQTAFNNILEDSVLKQIIP